MSVPNYSCIRLDRNWSENNVSIKKGGGICCYIQKDIIFSESEYSNLNISSKNIEMQIISINQPHMKKIAFINLYRPPQGNVTVFCDILHDTIVTLNANATNEIEIFVLGHFNINYTKSTSPGWPSIKHRRAAIPPDRGSRVENAIIKLSTLENPISSSARLIHASP